MQSRVEHRLLLLARESYRSSSRTPSPPVAGVETLSRMTLLIQNLPSNPRTATALDSARDPGLLRPARLRSASNGRPDRAGDGLHVPMRPTLEAGALVREGRLAPGGVVGL